MAKFDEILNAHTSKFFHSSEDIDFKMDPVLPFLQEYLSTAETVYLGGAVEPVDEIVKMVSYVLLYNIVTCQRPQLKHIEIYGHSRIVGIILTNVAKFCSDCDRSSLFFSPPETMFKLVLASPPPAPYLLKGLLISPKPLNSCKCVSRISTLTRNIVAFQLHSLEKVNIENLGSIFCHDDFNSITDYCALLSVLTELLKQPQLQFMSVDWSSLPEAYLMIEAFLCTETTHHQSLRVVVNQTQR